MATQHTPTTPSHNPLLPLQRRQTPITAAAAAAVIVDRAAGLDQRRVPAERSRSRRSHGRDKGNVGR